MSVQRAGAPCPGCGQRPLRLDTVDGRLVEIEDPCRCPEWRRLNGICRWCDEPVTGRRKVALYCARHRKLARKRAQRRYQRSAKGRDAHRRYRQRNREVLLARHRLRYKLDPEERERQAAYKRRWRRENPDKVRAQKRRAALRRGGKAPPWIRRWDEEVKAGKRTPKRARRNAAGERLCLTPDCDAVMKGRRKKCDACKRGLTPAKRRRSA